MSKDRQKKNGKKVLPIILMAVVVVAALVFIAVSGGNPNAVMPCGECDGAGIADEIACEVCGGTGKVAADSPYFATWTALLAPVIAIVLALITKEVYSSLIIGIVIGGLIAGNFNPVRMMDNVINGGFIGAISDTAGIFAFLVILGIMVALVNKAGGSAAFGKWAKTHIKSKTGAIICTFILGVLIFIDDYFNCLTVGGVMRPVTDSHNVSRVKLAYIIDSTAAPICMIAPISSWAAAVSSYASEGEGIKLFVQAIPYNLYSLLTLVFVVALTLMKFDYGPMKLYELKAQEGDITYGGISSSETDEDTEPNSKGIVLDLVLPVLVLVVVCVFALIYVGGFFDAESSNYMNFVGAFGDTDATLGLPWGGFIALVFTIVYLMIRKVVSFKEAMEAVPKGFIAMVPAILILTFATSLKNMTGMLGAKYYVEGLMNNAAAGLENFLPAIIFLVAIGLSFSTGTSWGTFGILIPIVCSIFPAGSEILIIGISACLAGAVCGDHCSPISDTTIMSSAGAQCNHVNHVSTQIPYAMTVAGISFIGYVLAGFVQNVFVVLPVSVALLIATLFIIKKASAKKAVKA